MSDLDLAALRQLHANTTQGPWEAYEDADWSGWGRTHFIATPDEEHPIPPDSGVYKHDAEFIATAHTIWPALLDEIEQLRADNAELNRACYQQHQQIKKLRRLHRLLRTLWKSRRHRQAEVERLGRGNAFLRKEFEVVTAVAGALLERAEKAEDGLARVEAVWALFKDLSPEHDHAPSEGFAECYGCALHDLRRALEGGQ